MTNTEMGVVYVAVGEQYCEEARRSIESVKQICPRLSICVFSDQSQWDSIDFYYSIKPTHNKCLHKIKPLRQSPYQKTLFLDTDTVVYSDIWEAFDLLDHFDMMFCHAPFRHTGYPINIPDCFVEINTGVIFYQHKSNVMDLLTLWEINYINTINNPNISCGYNDQTAFRECLFNLNTQLKYYILPSEFNLRVQFPYMVGGKCEPKILHGRGSRMDQALLNIAQKQYKDIMISND
jgi:hypothetical protein